MHNFPLTVQSQSIGILHLQTLYRHCTNLHLLSKPIPITLFPFPPTPIGQVGTARQTQRAKKEGMSPGSDSSV